MKLVTLILILSVTYGQSLAQSTAAGFLGSEWVHFPENTLPIQLPGIIEPEFENRTPPLDTTWVRSYIEEPIFIEGIARYNYYPITRFSIFDSITALVILGSGPAGGLEHTYLLCTFNRVIKRTGKLVVAYNMSEGGAGYVQLARINKDGRIDTQQQEWEGIGERTWKRGEWKQTATILPNGSIHEKQK